MDNHYKKKTKQEFSTRNAHKRMKLVNFTLPGGCLLLSSCNIPYKYNYMGSGPVALERKSKKIQASGKQSNRNSAKPEGRRPYLRVISDKPLLLFGSRFREFEVERALKKI